MRKRFTECCDVICLQFQNILSSMLNIRFVRALIFNLYSRAKKYHAITVSPDLRFLEIRFCISGAVVGSVTELFSHRIEFMLETSYFVMAYLATVPTFPWLMRWLKLTRRIGIDRAHGRSKMTGCNGIFLP